MEWWVRATVTLVVVVLLLSATIAVEVLALAGLMKGLR